MKINSNITAYLTNNAYSVNETRMSKATAKLSSGYKLNTSGDDPANFAIAAKMRAMIKGMDKVKTNTTTGMSVIQTAEAAMSDTEAMLQRMNELSVQAANGTMALSDRNAIQEEIDQLLEEIDRIAATTEFNGMKLLDGTFNDRGYTNVDSITVMDYSEKTRPGHYTIALDFDGSEYSAKVSTAALMPGFGSTKTLFGSASPFVTTQTLMGSDGTFNDYITIRGTSGSELRLKLESAKLYTGTSVVTLSDGTEHSNKSVTFNNRFMPGTYYLKDLGVEIKEGKPVVNSTDVTKQLFGESIEITEDTTAQTIKITGSNGAEITLSSDAFIEDNELGKDATIEIKRAPKENYAPQLDLDLTGMGSMRLQVGTEEGEVINASIPRMNTESMGIAALDLTTEDSATKAIDRVKGAIEYVNSARAKMGAYENRLENTESFIEAYNEDMTAALSRIQDTDMAEMMIEYTNKQVLSQAGITMLAQANEAPQQALQLLQ